MWLGYIQWTQWNEHSISSCENELQIKCNNAKKTKCTKCRMENESVQNSEEVAFGHGDEV